MIEIMSETEGNILVVKATEKLTFRDYEEVFIPNIIRRASWHLLI